MKTALPLAIAGLLLASVVILLEHWAEETQVVVGVWQSEPGEGQFGSWTSHLEFFADGCFRTMIRGAGMERLASQVPGIELCREGRFLVRGQNILLRSGSWRDMKEGVLGGGRLVKDQIEHTRSSLTVPDCPRASHDADPRLFEVPALVLRRVVVKSGSLPLKQRIVIWLDLAVWEDGTVLHRPSPEDSLVRGRVDPNDVRDVLSRLDRAGFFEAWDSPSAWHGATEIRARRGDQAVMLWWNGKDTPPWPGFVDLWGEAYSAVAGIVAEDVEGLAEEPPMDWLHHWVWK